jgi:hypothetical protein
MGVEYPPLRSGQVLAAKTRTRRGWGSGGMLDIQIILRTIGVVLIGTGT